MDIIFRGRRTGVQDRFREYATAKLDKLTKLDQKTISVDVEVTLERNPRQSGQRERVELTLHSRGPVIRAEAAANDRFLALDRALGKLEQHMRRACDRRKVRKPGHTGAADGQPAQPAGAQAADPGTDGRPPGTPSRTGQMTSCSWRRWSRSRWRATARSWCGRNSTLRHP